MQVRENPAALVNAGRNPLQKAVASAKFPISVSVGAVEPFGEAEARRFARALTERETGHPNGGQSLSLTVYPISGSGFAVLTTCVVKVTFEENAAVTSKGILPEAPAGSTPAGPWLLIPRTSRDVELFWLWYINGKFALQPEHGGGTCASVAPVAETRIIGAGKSEPLTFV
jgi:hypothetical protein